MILNDGFLGVNGQGLLIMASINSSDKGEKEEAELSRDVVEALEKMKSSRHHIKKDSGEDNGDGNAEMMIKNYSVIKKEQDKINGGHGMLNYGVMRQLRAMGYNAAICKSRWENAAGSLPSGNFHSLI